MTRLPSRRRLTAAVTVSLHRGHARTSTSTTGRRAADMTGYPEQESRGIAARDVQPGMIVWNPYGGARGRAEVASEARERPDGTIEFDCADGRTGHFRPQFRLRLDREAMDRRDAGAEAERLAGSDAGWPDEKTRQAAEADAWGGRGPSASYAEWLAEGREPEAGGTAEVVREYRDVGGSLSAAALEAPDGARLTVS